ncbi:hypothetical protein Pla123a_33020 [Posidoniimonas polymericola]|uniref:Uncharacterized protein n=1 Tax=Posidoniimonas polymericola TaxID=2528002 RepID=A0A5C5YH73_9BACT|nr:hypothetical protein [Posidoniimonas polymericola]TWT74479.1 hypothetical protein Pla123a_33020 [Posidoniimonas polymericola]
MNDPLTAVERRLNSRTSADAPGELRDTVLRDVRRELRAARWDRWLGRTAATLLVAGLALNSSLLLRGDRDFAATGPAASERSLVQTAVAVARATDVETARQVANQISAFNGRILTAEQLGDLDAAIAEALAKDRKG